MAIGPLMLDVEGYELTDEDKELLQHPIVGGVIYFARNFKSPEQVSELTSQIRAIRPELLIAVDQEGGRVQRFKSPLTRIPPMQSFSPLFEKNESSTLQTLINCGWLLASELKTMGIDFSFTPVLDVDKCFCEVIANRSFSENPAHVTAMAGALIEGLHEAGMAVVGKHFPGHGGVSGDSHHVLPIDNRSIHELSEKDLLPFMSLSEELDAIMPAHIRFPKVDENPVCFSKTWLKSVLRDDCGFTGAIMSDDLSMAGAHGMGTYAERARAAMAGGCDMVLVCNNREGAIEVLDVLEPLSSESESRLQKMRLRDNKPMSFGELKNMERWQKTNALLSVLSGDS